MYHAPQRDKRLFFDVIPLATDEYIAKVAALPTAKNPHDNPAWHIHGGKLPEHAGSPISFTMLLNLASVSNADSPEMLWGFIRAYMPEANAETFPFLAKLVHHAVAYTKDFVIPAKRFRSPTAVERGALVDLAESLKANEQASHKGETEAEKLQNLVYEIGKRHPFAPLKSWFDCLYQVLLGTPEGPRFGGFIALYGVERTIRLIETSLARG
jgi:lysyl-tRNA synthetase class 1